MAKINMRMNFKNLTSGHGEPSIPPPTSLGVGVSCFLGYPLKALSWQGGLINLI